LDQKRVEVVDLLDPEAKPFIIVDQGFAARAVRFAVYAVDLVPLPNYTRIFGFGTVIPDLDRFAAEVVVRAVVAHLGGPADNAGLRHWLAEHFEKLQQGLTASALARQRLMIDELDAQFGKAVYELTEPFDQCRAHLDSVPEAADDPISEQEQSEGFVEARCWFARKNDEEFGYAGEGAVLGRVLLGKTHWRLEVMGAARLDKLRARFEAVLGTRVKFAGARRDNMGARMRTQMPEYDASLVPPLLLTEPPRVISALSRVPATADASIDVAGDFMRERDRAFLDQPVPALEGKTPRAAASIPALRPTLLRLMKERVNQCDTHNLETGGTEDVNWMLRELGLTEILFEPPPPRPRMDLNSEFEAAAPREYRFRSLPLPPPMPAGAWTADEARVRFEKALGAFPKMTGAVQYLLDLDYPLFEDLDRLGGKLLEPRELQFLFPIAALLVLCFAPRNTRPPEIGIEAFLDEFQRQVGSLDVIAHEESEAKLLAWTHECRQPEILAVAFAMLATVTEHGPTGIRPKEKARMPMLLMLKSLINELDRAARGARVTG
jgi:hypothetical protein